MTPTTSPGILSELTIRLRISKPRRVERRFTIRLGLVVANRSSVEDNIGEVHQDEIDVQYEAAPSGAQIRSLRFTGINRIASPIAGLTLTGILEDEAATLNPAPWAILDAEATFHLSTGEVVLPLDVQSSDRAITFSAPSATKATLFTWTFPAAAPAEDDDEAARPKEPSEQTEKDDRECDLGPFEDDELVVHVNRNRHYYLALLLNKARQSQALRDHSPHLAFLRGSRIWDLPGLFFDSTMVTYLEPVDWKSPDPAIAKVISDAGSGTIVEMATQGRYAEAVEGLLTLTDALGKVHPEVLPTPGSNPSLEVILKKIAEGSQP